MNEAIAMIAECPQCGAPVQLNSNICEFCSSEYLVKSLSGLNRLDKKGIDKYIESYRKLVSTNPDNAELNSAIGICYLKLGLYDFAYKYFDKAMEDMMENSDLYFYSAICVLKGKRPFLVPLTLIRKAEEFLEAATSLDGNDGKYVYAKALIKYDYYYKKRLNTSPNFQELLEEADSCGICQNDKQLVEELLKLSI
jgi:tetratricopeptide (TPR) repeat protein